MTGNEEEPRRSGRATKGQYTKDRDINEEGTGKRKGKGKAAKGKEVADKNEDKNEDEGEEEDEEEAEEIIRCICGQYEEQEDEERDMICCDKCAAWQHNDCMLLPYSTANAPDQYFCEQCRPEDHRDLLDAIERGEKPWLEVARKREEARNFKKKKGGKRGRKSASGRPSDVHTEPSVEADKSMKSSPAPAASGQKRKLDDVNEPIDSKKARSTSVTQSSSPAPKNVAGRKPSVTAPQAQPVNSPDELNNAQRKSTAKALVKLFIDQAKVAQKGSSFSPPQGQTVAAVGNQLGLAVEHAMYASHVGSGDISDAYKTQLRAILHNVKSNTSLRDRLLKGELPPHALAVMNAEDMASEEQQQREAAMKAEVEKQAILVQEKGPRIRRTHKGDEYVDEDRQVAAEPDYAPARRESQSNQQAPEAKSPIVQSPSQAEKHLFSPASRKPPAINTQGRRPSGAPDRKSSSNFNIQEVWSSVGSPDHDQQFPPVSHRPVVPPSGPGAQPDAEIDELLKDEDNESEPYSPKEITQDESIVWNGRLDMEPIAGFRGSATFTAGANAPGLGLTWESLLPSNISINGRIDTKRADTYLCGLRYSQTTDVIVVSIRAPDHVSEHESFDKLFSYFKERDRYGVVAKHPVPAVKDTYIMPIEAGATNEQKPEFLQLLDNDNIESPNPERLLLIVLVIRFSELTQNSAVVPSTGSPLPPTSVSVTPQQGPYPGFNGQHTPQQFSPATPHQGGGMPFNGTYSPSTYQPQQPQQLSQSAAAAQQVLPPDMINSPAVQQLIYQAPALGVAEMNVLKDCIQENPTAAHDIQVLTSMLVEKQNAAPQA